MHKCHLWKNDTRTIVSHVQKWRSVQKRHDLTILNLQIGRQILRLETVWLNDRSIITHRWLVPTTQIRISSCYDSRLGLLSWCKKWGFYVDFTIFRSCIDRNLYNFLPLLNLRWHTFHIVCFSESDVTMINPRHLFLYLFLKNFLIFSD